MPNTIFHLAPSKQKALLVDEASLEEVSINYLPCSRALISTESHLPRDKTGEPAALFPKFFLP